MTHLPSQDTLTVHLLSSHVLAAYYFTVQYKIEDSLISLFQTYLYHLPVSFSFFDTRHSLHHLLFKYTGIFRVTCLNFFLKCAHIMHFLYWWPLLRVTRLTCCASEVSNSFLPLCQQTITSLLCKQLASPPGKPLPCSRVQLLC